ncbi:MAG: amidohydrolase family protein, partial [Clostridia bacterium]|nr:amidohydrolase family protein [Clostridia bacterium]
MNFEIIDFHTHPFIEEENNICSHKQVCGMSADNTLEVFGKLGVSKICGSVISGHKDENETSWDRIKRNNDTALKLRERYGDFYIPGFHVHSDFVDESIAEMHRMKKLGVNLIGELVPYMDGWKNYANDGFSAILDEAGKNNMIVSFHSQEEDEMDAMVKRHKDVIFVAAHPGEYSSFMRHVERMKMSENYYLDLSGYGIFRYGMLRRAIDEFGV